MINFPARVGDGLGEGYLIGQNCHANLRHGSVTQSTVYRNKFTKIHVHCTGTPVCCICRYSTNYDGLILPYMSPRLHIINPVMRRIYESGIIFRLYGKYKLDMLNQKEEVTNMF